MYPVRAAGRPARSAGRAGPGGRLSGASSAGRQVCAVRMIRLSKSAQLARNRCGSQAMPAPGGSDPLLRRCSDSQNARSRRPRRAVRDPPARARMGQGRRQGGGSVTEAARCATAAAPATDGAHHSSSPVRPAPRQPPPMPPDPSHPTGQRSPAPAHEQRAEHTPHPRVVQGSRRWHGMGGSDIVVSPVWAANAAPAGTGHGTHAIFRRRIPIAVEPPTSAFTHHTQVVGPADPMPPPGQTRAGPPNRRGLAPPRRAGGR